MVAYIFNSSTGGRSHWRLAWCTEEVLGQRGLHRGQEEKEKGENLDVKSLHEWVLVYYGSSSFSCMEI